MPESTDTKLNATALKNALWETMKELRDGSIAPGAGDAIAAQAREILRTSNTQLKIINQARLDVPVELIRFAQSKEE
jgi:cell division protein FtsB